MKYADLQTQLAQTSFSRPDYGSQAAMWNAINCGIQFPAGMANSLAMNSLHIPSKIERARERFGQPFAHEPGATWQPRKVPVLTEWMQKRGKEQ